MKKRFFLLLSLFALLLSVGAFADGTKTYSKTQSGITFTVTYPSSIQCGEETVFQLASSGGSSNCQYRIYGLYTYDGTENVNVYDISAYGHSDFSTDTSWPFTFYASGTYYIRFCVMDLGVSPSIYFTTDPIKLVIDDPDYPSVDVIADRVAQECLDAGCSTDYEKALWLNDWITDNCDYDYTYSYCSAEGALARGSGTCEAHHRAYVMLLNRVGVETQRVQSSSHVWTGVKMEGKWYQIDTTWNDAEPDQVPSYLTADDIQHFYFGLTDEIISGASQGTHTHTPVSGAESVSLDENYFIVTKRICAWSDEYKTEIQQHLAAGDTEFTIAVSHSNWANNYKNVIYPIVAYQLSENEDWGAYSLQCSYESDVLSFTAESRDLERAEELYFSGEAIDLSSLGGDYSSVTAASLSSYAPVFSGTLPEGLEYEGMTLTLQGTEAALRFVFCLTQDGGAYTVLLDGESASLGMQGEWYITSDVPAAAAGEYGTAHTLSVTDGTAAWSVTASPLSYAQKTLSDAPDTEEAKLMQVFAGNS